ncbi:MAG: molybdenum cofactor guanylyltransferase [Actinomycetota bacterium]
MIAGVVLAGGASRRMGRDKALVEVGGRPMAAHVLDALRANGFDGPIVYGGDPGALASLEVPVLPDAHPGEGPVGGVLGALGAVGKRSGVDAAIVVPCDIPRLDASVLAPLRERWVDGPPVDVVVARTDRIEPICAIWSVEVTDRVESAFRAGERALHRVLERVDVAEVEVPAAPLHNVNTPADLADVVDTSAAPDTYRPDTCSPDAV